MLLNQPSCNGISGFQLTPITYTKDDYTDKCDSFSYTDCDTICKGKQGVLRQESDKRFCYNIKVLKQVCARINPGEELEYYTGCYIDGSPFYYQTLQPGEIYEMRYIVSMVRLMSDPYGTAYKLSDDNVHFFDLLADTTTISIIKWIFFLSALLFVV